MALSRQKIVIILTLLASLLVGGVALAQTDGGASALLSTGYDLTWWTVDGGGETVSGGAYSLTGTAGQ